MAIGKEVDPFAALHNSPDFLRALKAEEESDAQWQENMRISNDPEYIRELSERMSRKHPSPPTGLNSTEYTQTDLPFLNLDKSRVQKDTELLMKHSNARFNFNKDENKRVEKLTSKPRRKRRKPGRKEMYDRGMKALHNLQQSVSPDEINRKLTDAEIADYHSRSDRKS